MDTSRIREMSWISKPSIVSQQQPPPPIPAPIPPPVIVSAPPPVVVPEPVVAAKSGLEALVVAIGPATTTEPNGENVGVFTEVFTPSYVNFLLLLLFIMLALYLLYLFWMRTTRVAIETHTKTKQTTEELVAQYERSVRGTIV